MSDIFLSYKSEDRPRAKIIAEALEQHGYSVWWDRVIPPGRTFDDVIEQELDASRCVVALWSNESVKSKWVKTEASEGDRRGILVPVLIDYVKIPLEFRRIQAARLINWQGALPNPEFDLLLKSIGQILGRPLEREIIVKKQSINEINPIWKWGSMIVSLVFIFIFWLWCFSNNSQAYCFSFRGNCGESEGWGPLIILLLFGLPATIYLIYKERKGKIKYGLIWILFPILTLSFGEIDMPKPEGDIVLFFFLSVPAIIIDIVYVYKKPNNNK